MQELINKINNYIEENDLTDSNIIFIDKVKQEVSDNIFNYLDICMTNLSIFLIDNGKISHIKLSEIKNIFLKKSKKLMTITTLENERLTFRNSIEKNQNIYKTVSAFLYREDSKELLKKIERIFYRFCMMKEVLVDDIQNEIDKLYKKYKYYNVAFYEIELYLIFQYDLVAMELLIEKIDELFYYKPLSVIELLFSHQWKKNAIVFFKDYEHNNQRINEILSIAYDYIVKESLDKKRLISCIIDLLDNEFILTDKFYGKIYKHLLLIDKNYVIDNFSDVVENEFYRIIDKAKMNEDNDRISSLEEACEITVNGLNSYPEEALDFFENNNYMSYLFEKYNIVINSDIQKNGIIKSKGLRNEGEYSLDGYYVYIASLVNCYYQKNDKVDINLINRNFTLYIREISRYKTVLYEEFHFLLQSEIYLLNKMFDKALDFIKATEVQLSKRKGKVISEMIFPDEKYKILKAWGYKSIGTLIELSRVVSKKYLDLIFYAIKDLEKDSTIQLIDFSEVRLIFDRLINFGDGYKNKLEAIKKNLLTDNKSEMKIGIIGETSTGKSTFINSLLNTNIFYSTQEEATGIPTYISNSGEYTIEIFDKKNNKAIVYTEGKNTSDNIYSDFFCCSGNDNVLLSKSINESLRTRVNKMTLNNKLEDFLVDFTKKKTGNKMIGKVEIKGPFNNLSNKYSLIDTPGLNASDNQEIRTLNMISFCEIVFYLIDGRFPLKKEEIKKLKMISKKVTKVYLLINKMDLVIKGNPFESQEVVENGLISRINNLIGDIDNIEVVCISSIKSTDEKYRFYYDNLLNLWDRLDQTYEKLSEAINDNSCLSILNMNSKFLYYDLVKEYNSINYDNSLKYLKKQVEFVVNNRYKRYYWHWKSNILYKNIQEIIKRNLEKDINNLEFDHIFEKKSDDALKNALTSFFEKDYKNKVKNINNEITKFVAKTFKENVLEDLMNGLEAYFSSELIIDLEIAAYTKYRGYTINQPEVSGGGIFSTGVGMAIGSVLGPLGIIAGGILGSLFSNDNQKVKTDVLTNYFNLLEEIYYKYIQEECIEVYIEKINNQILTKLKNQLDQNFVSKKNTSNNIKEKFHEEQEVYENIVKIHNTKYIK